MATAVLVSGACLVALMPALGQEARPGRRVRPGSPAWQERIMERFPEADADGDGVVSPEELRTFFEARREARDDDAETSPAWRRGGRFGPRGFGGGMGPGEPGARGFSGRRMPPGAGMVMAIDMLLDRFEEIDRDQDGKLGYEELEAYQEALPIGPPMMRPGPWGGPGERPERFRRHLLERFPDADADEDGVLSDEELKTLKESQPRFRREMRGPRGERGPRGDREPRGEPEQSGEDG